MHKFHVHRKHFKLARLFQWPVLSILSFVSTLPRPNVIRSSPYEYWAWKVTRRVGSKWVRKICNLFQDQCPSVYSGKWTKRTACLSLRLAWSQIRNLDIANLQTWVQLDISDFFFSKMLSNKGYRGWTRSLWKLSVKEWWMWGFGWCKLSSGTCLLYGSQKLEGITRNYQIKST